MNIFKNVAIDIPNKSGFDMSHENFFSSYCGTLTPAMVDTLLPGDKVDLSAIANVKLPPFASEFYGRIEFKMEAFFVPFRLLYGGWKEFITIPLEYQGINTRPETISGNYMSRKVSSVYLPMFTLTDNSTYQANAGNIPFNQFFKAGTLADYLGYKVDPDTIPSSSTGVTMDVNAMPFLAYHKIWDDWYRDTKLVSSCFVKVTPNDLTTAQNNSPSAAYLPYVTISGTTLASSQASSSSKLRNFGLSSSGTIGASAMTRDLFHLRQRSFAKDYFTNATPLPQAGNQQSVGFTISNNQGSFSIASLRAANSIQMWLERNNLAGNRYPDVINANFGVYPADAITDRVIYLGRVNVPVYSKSVYQTADSVSGSQLRNPMKTIGADYGSPQGVKSGTFCKNFEVTEHGYLFVMASLVPTAFYSTGIDSYFHHNRVTDFGWPLLQGTGDQQILSQELCRDPWNQSTQTPFTFGYTQRYSEFKFKNDQIHGLLRDGQSLDSFALQRSFEFANGVQPNISYAFNEIPRSFLDQVSAVTNEQSNFGYWADVYFNYKKVSTLAAYSIPTLGDLKNVHKEVIPLGGKRL